MTGDNPVALIRLKAHTLHAGEALRRHEKLRQVSYRRGIRNARHEKTACAMANGKSNTDNRL